jgi:hypothetical protein
MRPTSARRQTRTQVPVKLRRPSKAFFITGRRLPLSYSALRRMFRQLVQSVGIKNAGAVADRFTALLLAENPANLP